MLQDIQPPRWPGQGRVLQEPSWLPPARVTCPWPPHQLVPLDPYSSGASIHAPDSVISILAPSTSWPLAPGASRGLHPRPRQRDLHPGAPHLLAPGSRPPAPDSRLLAPGSWLPAPGSRPPAPDSRLLAPGSWLPAPGSRPPASGPPAPLLYLPASSTCNTGSSINRLLREGAT